MKILIFSTIFHPSIGGIETVSELLAKGFKEAGNELIVVTNTPLIQGQTEKDWPFLIYRRPSFWLYWKLLNRADVIFHNCISLKQLFPDLLYRGKFFVSHHTWYRQNQSGKMTMSARLKRWVIHWVHNAFISRAIQEDLGVPGKLIPNTYDSECFKVLPGITRDKELVFLGRLVSDKGCQKLLEAMFMAQKQDQSFRPSLVIVGDGPERNALESFTAEHLNGQVRFVGKLQGEQLARLLNQHQLLVVPSLWEEPFGIVALEGLACGCLVIGSEKGGLKDAIGPCGWTFPNGDTQVLADLLKRVLKDKSDWVEKYAAVPDHLYRHQPRQVVNQYLDYFKQYVSIPD